MLAETSMLNMETIEAQTAIELPDRESLVTVIIGCIGVCVGSIRIRIGDVNVAAQVCAAVQALNVALLAIQGLNAQFTCRIKG